MTSSGGDVRRKCARIRCFNRDIDAAALEDRIDDNVGVFGRARRGGSETSSGRLDATLQKCADDGRYAASTRGEKTTARDGREINGCR